MAQPDLASNDNCLLTISIKRFDCSIRVYCQNITNSWLSTGNDRLGLCLISVYPPWLCH